MAVTGPPKSSKALYGRWPFHHCFSGGVAALLCGFCWHSHHLYCFLRFLLLSGAATKVTIDSSYSKGNAHGSGNFRSLGPVIHAGFLQCAFGWRQATDCRFSNARQRSFGMECPQSCPCIRTPRCNDSSARQSKGIAFWFGAHSRRTNPRCHPWRRPLQNSTWRSFNALAMHSDRELIAHRVAPLSASPR
jgi:hypothetical protein